MTATEQGISPYLRALRPHQWHKNLLVFAAPLFAFRLDVPTLLQALGAFALLSMASSGFYLLNDVRDLESDRQHPVKRRRPIASGSVPVAAAVVMAVVLLGAALGLSFWQSRALGIALGMYAVLQLLYNTVLKRTVLLDVMAIAAGFVLRAWAGAAATDLPTSPWFLLCTMLLALFIAIEKRKAELRRMGGESASTRKVLGFYSLPLLARMENTVAAGAIITYAIWSSGPQVQGAPTAWMLITIPFVLYGVFRYQLLSTPREESAVGDDDQAAASERPEEIFLTDLPIVINVVAWAAVSGVILLLDRRELLP
jgi:4-hydroxybenzoate polyprenyltransferase